MNRLTGLRTQDDGTTLVELMVTMIIATIVLAGTVAVSSGLQRTAATVFARQDQTDIGRQAADRMTTTLRSASKPGLLNLTCSSGCTDEAFMAASGAMSSFYANLNNDGGATGPVKVGYAVPASGAQSGHLVETVQKAVVTGSTYSFCNTSDASCRTATVTTRDLTPGATVATSPPLLRYFDSSGAELAAGGAVLTADQRAAVMSVEITVSVQRQSATKADPSTYVTRIDLPNQQSVLAPR